MIFNINLKLINKKIFFKAIRMFTLVKKLKIMSKNNPMQPKKNSNNFAKLTKSNSVPLSSLTASKTAKSTQDQICLQT